MQIPLLMLQTVITQPCSSVIHQITCHLFMLLQALHAEIEMKDLDFQVTLLMQGVGTPFPPHCIPGVNFSTPQKCPMLRQQSQKMRFVGSNSQIYYDNLRFCTKGYLQISKQRACFQGSTAMVFKEKNIAMVFNEATVYDFSLPNKNCQRHLETRVSNVWNLIECKLVNLQCTDDVNRSYRNVCNMSLIYSSNAINKTLFVFANVFTVNAHHTQTG